MKTPASTRTVVQEAEVCSCGKVWKNSKGLRIHQQKIGCKVDNHFECEAQRIRQPSQTEEATQPE
jgi:hypothetical protein